jgi:hypothetical protein
VAAWSGRRAAAVALMLAASGIAATGSDGAAQATRADSPQQTRADSPQQTRADSPQQTRADSPQAPRADAAQASRTARLSPPERAAQLEAALARAPLDAATALDLARALFFLAVDERDAVARGRDVVSRIHDDMPAFARSHHALLQAYEGAFLALEARHGTWPHARLRAVRSGLRLLDAAVAEAPDDIEVRYLRLVNTHYLPGLFGRRESAREDRRRVEQLLTEARRDVPPAFHDAIVGFIRDVQG